MENLNLVGLTSKKLQRTLGKEYTVCTVELGSDKIRENMQGFG